ncbi:MAG: hypothetical protein IJW24_03685 [Clostridia bacterium]|nr:hypothetical protein [Clostridia bacterium]
MKMCVLEDNKICNNCGECDMCDLDPKKRCDNCGKCLDEFNTDEKGFVKIGIDKILQGEGSDLDSFYQMAGLVDDDEEENSEECDCCDHDHDCNCSDDCHCHDDE